MEQAALDITRVSAFVRQHTHDIRNHLNGLDLEAALLTEIVTDPEAQEGVARIRGQIRSMAAELRALSAKLSPAEPRPGPLKALELFLIWQEQAAELGLDIEWETTLADERINVDTVSVAEVLKELLVNAKHFTGTGGLRAAAELEGKNARFELRESKKASVDPSEWGKKPFVSTKRGGYGLGLWTAEQHIRANRGTIRREFRAPGELLTIIHWPLENQAAA